MKNTINKLKQFINKKPKLKKAIKVIYYIITVFSVVFTIFTILLLCLNGCDNQEKPQKPVSQLHGDTGYSGEFYVIGANELNGSNGIKLMQNLYYAVTQNMGSPWLVGLSTAGSWSYNINLTGDTTQFARFGNWENFLSSNQYQNNPLNYDGFVDINYITLTVYRPANVDYFYRYIQFRRINVDNTINDIATYAILSFDEPIDTNLTTYDSGSIYAGGNLALNMTSIVSTPELAVVVFKEGSILYEQWGYIIQPSDYQEGYNTGYLTGRTEGYNQGYQEGNNIGYNAGLLEGASDNSYLSNPFDIISSAFNSVATFLDIEILPNFKLGVLLFVPIIVGLIIIIVKIVKA